MEDQTEITVTERNTCLLISVENTFFAMNALNVQEILELPALQYVDGAPPYIAGFVNMRGDIIVVLDLRICLGKRFQSYSLVDHLIIVKGENYLFGLVTPEVHDLVQLDILKTSSEAMLSKIAPLFPFITTIGKFHEQIVFLVDTILLEKHLLQVSPELFKSLKIESLEDKSSVFLIESYEQNIFQERARRLIDKVVFSQQSEQLILLTVILLKQEYYAVETIREFCSINEYTLIPCAPPYVFGFFNLRGHVLPIIDVWQILQGEKNQLNADSKVLIVEFEGSSVGVLVDNVENLMFSNPLDHRTVPLSIKIVGEAFVKNTVKYEKEVIPILEISKILKSIQSKQ